MRMTEAISHAILAQREAAKTNREWARRFRAKGESLEKVQPYIDLATDLENSADILKDSLDELLASALAEKPKPAPAQPATTAPTTEAEAAA